MASIPGSVRFTGFVAPSDTTDTYAVTDETYNRGGYRSVTDAAGRQAITPDRRKVGMLVKQLSDSTFWTLTGGILDANWEEVSFGGGADSNILAVKAASAITALTVVTTRSWSTVDSRLEVIAPSSIYTKPTGLARVTQSSDDLFDLQLRGNADVTYLDTTGYATNSPIYYDNQGYLTCINTGSPVVGRLVDPSLQTVFFDVISADVSNVLRRIDIASFDYNINVKAIEILADSKHAYATAPNFLRNFDGELADLVWFEVQTTALRTYKDLRFSTLAQLQDFLNLVTVVPHSCLVKAYIYQVVQTKINKLFAYNMAYSNLKTRNKYHTNQPTLQKLYDITNSNTVPQFLDGFLTALVQHFTSTTPLNIVAARSVFGLASSRRHYNLVATKAKGFINQMCQQAVGGSIYQRATRQVVPMATVLTAPAPIYLLDTCVVRTNSWMMNHYELLGEHPTDRAYYESGSLLRVYHWVNDLLNPTLDYFTIRPIGVDSYILSNPEKFGSTRLGSTTRIFMLITSPRLQPFIRRAQTSGSFGNLDENVFARLNAVDIAPYLDGQWSRSITKFNARNFRFFVGETNSGVCSSYYAEIEMRVNQSGAKIKRMVKGEY